ncbi:MAG TPA: MAPEG family protein [Rhizomicrobium sp.]|jgi:uncharacterized MAPEG superfamily protein|nr:MAPEG family protein [Rhizomicrobium sp.]
MTFDLWMLTGAVFLGLVHIGAESFAYKKQVGHAYTISARDEPKMPTGMAGRYHRALRNFLETFPLFAAAIVLVHAANRLGIWSEIGSAVYLVGRIVYFPLYIAGVPHMRTVFWQIATIGIVLIFVQILV